MKNDKTIQALKIALSTQRLTAIRAILEQSSTTDDPEETLWEIRKALNS